MDFNTGPFQPKNEQYFEVSGYTSTEVGNPQFYKSQFLQTWQKSSSAGATV